MEEVLSCEKKQKIIIDRLKELLGDGFEITIDCSEAIIYAVTTEEKITFLGRKKSVEWRERVAVIYRVDEYHDTIKIYNKAVYEPLKEFGNEFHYRHLLKDWPGVETEEPMPSKSPSVKKKKPEPPMLESTNMKPRYERLMEK